MPRTNAERTAATRAMLIAAGRELFAAHGYAATSTEAILADTGLTRGALYHHFRNKADLFSAICETLHAEATVAIAAAATGATAWDALANGCEAWIAFMQVPAHRRILVIEAPTVLGWERWQAIDAAHGFPALREGVAAAAAEGFGGGVSADSLAVFLNGAINQLVLRDDADALASDFRSLLTTLRGQ